MQRLSFINLESYIQEKGFIVLDHCYKCNKVSYRSEEEAKIIAADMRAKGKGHSYVYECPKGKGWHLTSQKPRSDNVIKFRLNKGSGGMYSGFTDYDDDHWWKL